MSNRTFCFTPLLSLLMFLSFGSDVTDLIITEVDPDADVVEVTNPTNATVSVGTDVQFCYAFNYEGLTGAPFVMSAGETRQFTLSNNLTDTGSDIWLYHNISVMADFSNPANMIGGLKFGTSSPTGRENEAVTAGLWPSADAFVAAPAGSDTIQLNSTDPTNPGNYKIGANTLGTYFTTGDVIANPLPDIVQGSAIVKIDLVINGLLAPLGVIEPDDGSNRLLIYDQGGTITAIDKTTFTPAPEPFMDASGVIVPIGAFGPGSYDERGFLGLALHPNFSSNGKIYTYMSEPVTIPADFTTTTPSGGFNHQAVVAEWTCINDSGTFTKVDMGTKKELLRIDEPQFNHDGGSVRFGPDGYLYITLGDGGNRDDEGEGHAPQGNGQEPGNVYGTILRIDVDGSDSNNGQYGIPGTNPFIGNAGIPDEIYAWGFRNPFQFSFDSLTGDLYLADVGQGAIEEINIIESGMNYGWRIKEGSFFFDPMGGSNGDIVTVPVVPVPTDLVDPIAEFDHDDGIAIIGGFVYRGAILSDLVGKYVFGDFSGNANQPFGRLFYLDTSDVIKELQIRDSGGLPIDLPIYVRGFGEDLDGEIYITGTEVFNTSFGTGAVYKLTPDLSSVNAWWIH